MSDSLPKILIVDDTPANLYVMRRVFKTVDAELITAASGAEALEQAQKHEFAVALLDVRMPGMDGYELAGLLRERDETAGLPIIFVSAEVAAVEQAIQGYKTGITDYIVKPFDPVSLRAKVQVFLDAHTLSA